MPILDAALAEPTAALLVASAGVGAATMAVIVLCGRLASGVRRLVRAVYRLTTGPSR